jgi:hypothetical protein
MGDVMVIMFLFCFDIFRNLHLILLVIVVFNKSDLEKMSNITQKSGPKNIFLRMSFSLTCISKLRQIVFIV